MFHGNGFDQAYVFATHFFFNPDKGVTYGVFSGVALIFFDDEVGANFVCKSAAIGIGKQFDGGVVAGHGYFSFWVIQLHAQILK